MPSVLRRLKMTHKGELVEVSSGSKLTCPLRENTRCNAKTCAAFLLENYKGFRARCCFPGTHAHNTLGLLEDDSAAAFGTTE
jgi:hypothetical protein